MISVIVPIYNVEPYVRQCVDSLLAQTGADIEILLIDDGSTDRSGMIAEEYTDTRIRAFHLQNGGLSAARNFGIEHARGEWLMFVDGDDYVLPEFCSAPLDLALATGADLVAFRYCKYRDGEVNPVALSQWREGEADWCTAVDMGTELAWNKLYRKSLFESIRYPVGKVYEDIATTYKLVHASQKSVFSDKCLYVYRKRPGSISVSKTRERLYQGLEAALLRREDLKKWGYTGDPDNFPEFRAWDIIVLVEPCDDEMYRLAVSEFTNVKRAPKWMSRKQRVSFFLWKRCNRLFRVVRKRYTRPARPAE